MDDTHPLKTYRESQQPPLTQGQLADILDVDRVTVARWETGTRKIDDELLPLVSQVTGIPKVYLRPDLARLLEQPEVAS